MIDDCDKTLAQLQFNTLDDYNRHVYVKAMRLCLQGLIAYAGRYEALARAMAEKEKDLKRQQEMCIRDRLEGVFLYDEPKKSCCCRMWFCRFLDCL